MKIKKIKIIVYFLKFFIEFIWLGSNCFKIKLKHENSFIEVFNRVPLLRKNFSLIFLEFLRAYYNELHLNFLEPFWL